MQPRIAHAVAARRGSSLRFARLLIPFLLCADLHAAATTDLGRSDVNPSPAALQSFYPIVVTDSLDASRDFYVRWFGFQPLFEASWFIYLQAGNGQPWGIAFMSSDHPSQPPGPETFSGKGVFLTLQVVDAAAEFERLKHGGVRIAYPLRDEKWGQRRFGVIDPSGMWLDVVQQTEPAPGFWDPYMKP